MFETKNTQTDRTDQLGTRHCLCLQQFGQRIILWPILSRTASILNLFVAGDESANRIAHKGKSRAAFWICAMKFVANVFIVHAPEILCSLLLICMNSDPGSLKDMPKEHGEARARLTKAPNLTIVYMYLVVENQSKEESRAARTKRSFENVLGIYKQGNAGQNISN